MAGGILTRSTGLAAILLVITSAFPMRPVAMELKIVGNQIILSGPVVGDEPGVSGYCYLLYPVRAGMAPLI
jgi:hypothetical protein